MLKPAGRIGTFTTAQSLWFQELCFKEYQIPTALIPYSINQAYGCSTCSVEFGLNAFL